MLGYPIEHSLSPAMHNAAIAALGLHFVYIPFSVRPDDLGPAIKSLARLGIVGVNLTIPHKVGVLPFLDEIAPEAEFVGAVNTVHQVDGRLRGYNTDGEGFMAPLRERGFQAAGRKVLVLGAGGAARSVVYHLALAGAAVTVTNRSPEKAEALAGRLRSRLNEAVIEIRELGPGLSADIAAADLVVNTTSVGMVPGADAIPGFEADTVHPGQLVYDLIYRPLETDLLKTAKRRGADTINGTAMLVRQGAAAFKIWTGVEPPLDVMENAVLQGLSEE